LASLVFGGAFPTLDALSRLFVIHVLFLPVLLIGAISAHLLLVWVQKHTQYRTARATEDNVVGLPFWPGQVFRSTGLFFLTGAVLVLVAGLVQINPVWLYGPYLPYVTTVPAQPDWYVGWLEGALRIGLPIEPTILGVTIPSPFVPGVFIPGLLVTLFVLWPFLEARITGDHAEHNLLDWPWQRPIRTATGAAAIALFLVLTLAGGNDVIGLMINVPVEALTMLFRVLLVVSPVATWLIVFVLCREIRARHAAEPAQPSGPLRLRRTAGGGFEEIEP
jgi:ubiquinol-cytochrome c reductase cytochrome b subunit